MEIVDGVVYHIRQSRSKPDKETVYVMVDDEAGQDGRVFPFHTDPGFYRKGDRVEMKIDGSEATILY
ncbi:TPA: hypothetical protein DCF80_03460 [Candidatus Saccharibacteria bacterium]|nr:hypothetical protein [Candidatus Saccharibacteria bacterium]HRK41289.1 hypothetical protein [Candidatus Saccharibacteria bacterium]